MTKSFIETQFPVSKVSKESYKERKAGINQTLTSLGKWWGRKPLILIRAALIGLLMPASEDPVKDREIFLKILTMNEEGLWKRKSKNIPLKELYRKLNKREREQWFDSDSNELKQKWKKGISAEDKIMVQKIVFQRFSYDEKLKYCCRPEHIDGPSVGDWDVVNNHLNTTAKTLKELIYQLGNTQFGHVPKVGDAFCGGGSVPFEVARLGCKSFGSDLNPVAALLTWAALNIIGGGQEVVEEVHKEQRKVYEVVNQKIIDWGIEHNKKGWRADAYLYCSEVICPECDWKVPLAPSWVIGEKSHCIAKLLSDDNNRCFEIHIESGVSAQEMEKAKQFGTEKKSALLCPHCGQSSPIAMLRRAGRIEKGKQIGFRSWESSDLVPSPSDVFQERLYCIRWVETFYDKEGKQRTCRHYRAPNEHDFRNEERVLNLLSERFSKWQQKGYIPSRPIEPGDKTDEPIRTRGWTYWHHLFLPRQLLLLGLFLEASLQQAHGNPKQAVLVENLLELGRIIDTKGLGCKLLRWNPHPSKEGHATVFSNQAINTLYNFCHRTFVAIEPAKEKNAPINAYSEVKTIDARSVNCKCDIWITDPPYADAINYHELSEFFLSWYEKHLTKLFADWYSDTKRALAITGSTETFKKNMVDCYRNLAENMTDSGAQIVMFTHQDAGVWADLALILWSSGLSVTAAWCIATETDSELRKGNYVQGTVLLVLRKQVSDETAFFDELYPEVEEEVKHQLNEMLALDDQEDPNFGDTDYQLAAYSAALRVLTRYHKIEDMDITRELSRIRQPGEQSPVVNIIDEAVKIACDHLVPQGIESFTWKSLTPEERFYLKGLEIESHGEYRAGAYQELARGFGLREYRSMLAGNKANQTKLKTASQFGARVLGDSGFGATLVRHVLFAIRESVRTGEIVNGRNWFHNELKQEYWNERQTVVKLLNYLASLGQNKNMTHWKDDADAARILAGAVENDHV